MSNGTLTHLNPDSAVGPGHSTEKQFATDPVARSLPPQPLCRGRATGTPWLPCRARRASQLACGFHVKH